MEADKSVKPPALSDFVPDYRIYRMYGRMTVGTHILIQFLTFLWSIPGILLIPIFTFVGGVLTGIPGVGLVFWVPVESLLWALRSVLMGSSRLWENVPLLRILLVIVGVPISVFGFAFVSLTPGVNFSAKFRKAVVGAMCDAWPLSHFAYERGEARLRLLQENDDVPAT